jgi:hypothetical protein
MKLVDLLNESDHEVWFHIMPEGGSDFDLWSADYHGGYEPTMEDVEPCLEREIGGDGFFIVERRHPELNNKKVPMICVPLMEDS